MKLPGITIVLMTLKAGIIGPNLRVAPLNIFQIWLGVEAVDYQAVIMDPSAEVAAVRQLLVLRSLCHTVPILSPIFHPISIALAMQGVATISIPPRFASISLPQALDKRGGLQTGPPVLPRLGTPLTSVTSS